MPSGFAVHHARAVTNVYDLTRPYRSPNAYRPSGDEALAALTLLADLRDWLTDVEPALIQAARDAGVTWDQLAPILRVGARRAARGRYARLLRLAAERAARDAEADDDVARDVLEDVPGDVPDVPAGAAVPETIERDWDYGDLCLWRDGGQWSLQAGAQ
ncbi:hypothetical protein [Nonomuraea sp. NPDC049480]|uniref:hypothetical protein n=1 Tax=Nonomuraea sp. NPDC049480 TaxID=3364353 RepID=UPI00379A9B33